MKLLYANDEEALISFTKSEINDIVVSLRNLNYSKDLYYLDHEFEYALEKMKYELLNKEEMKNYGKETNR